eukprot:2205552-Rhodomonas_salina.1
MRDDSGYSCTALRKPYGTPVLTRAHLRLLVRTAYEPATRSPLLTWRMVLPGSTSAGADDGVRAGMPYARLVLPSV